MSPLLGQCFCGTVTTFVKWGGRKEWMVGPGGSPRRTTHEVDAYHPNEQLFTWGVHPSSCQVHGTTYSV